MLSKEEIFCRVTYSSGHRETSREKLSRLERILRDGKDRIVPEEQAKIQLTIDDLKREMSTPPNG